MTRDDLISFDEARHIYRVDGEKYTSVSKFIKNFFPQFDKDAVVDKILSSRKMDDPDYKYYGMSRKEILSKWDAKGKASRDKGDHLHQCIENYLKSEPVEEPPLEFNYFLQFMKDFGFEPYRAEWRIWDETHLIAGTVDSLLKWGDDFILCDWKRSQEIKMENPWESAFDPIAHLPNCNFSHYSLQLNTYRHILQSHYDIDVGAMRLVVLHLNNPSYQIHKVPDLDREVRAMLGRFTESPPF